MTFKRLLALGTVMTMVFGTFTVSAAEDKTEEKMPVVETVEVEGSYEDNYEGDLQAYLDELVEYANDDADMAELKGLVTEIYELEMRLGGLYDELFESDGVDWDAYFEDAEDWEEEWDDEDFEDVDFEMFREEDIPEIVEEIASEFKDDLDAATVTKAKGLVEDLLKLEVKGDFDEADKIWEQLEGMEVFDWED